MFKNILLVDDDAITNFINQRLIKNSLDPELISVANNGSEAIDFLNNDLQPDLILLDINMPVMDGFEFIVFFNQMSHIKKPLVVVLTTSSDPGDIKRMKELGVKTFLNKPLTERSLKMIVAGVENIKTV